jgi:hypothetical protein
MTSFRFPLSPLARLLLAGIVIATSALAQPAPKKVDRAPATAVIVPTSENWRMDGDVPVHSLLISLQGLANRDYPRLYVEYPRTGNGRSCTRCAISLRAATASPSNASR